MVSVEPSVKQLAHGQHRRGLCDGPPGPVLGSELSCVLLSKGAAAADGHRSVLSAASHGLGAGGDAYLPHAQAAFTNRTRATSRHRTQRRSRPRRVDEMVDGLTGIPSTTLCHRDWP